MATDRHENRLAGRDPVARKELSVEERLELLEQRVSDHDRIYRDQEGIIQAVKVRAQGVYDAMEREGFFQTPSKVETRLSNLEATVVVDEPTPIETGPFGEGARSNERLSGGMGDFAKPS